MATTKIPELETTEDLSELHQYIPDWWPQGIVGLVAIFLVITAITKPENIKVWAGWIWYFLSYIFAGLRKKAVRFRIEGPCTKALKKISAEMPEIEIPDLKINWVGEDNLQSVLTSGKAIVKLKFDDDNTRNIVKATTIYVRDAFLPHAKGYLSSSLRKAIDLSITKKILLNVSFAQKNKQIVTQFINENLDHESEVLEKCEEVEEIDDHGLFTRIVLRELDSFGGKLFGRTVKSEYSHEADSFLQFMHKIATRDFEENTPLAFPESIIKVGVILVAKRETYLQYGLDPYLRRIKLGIAQGIKTFYLLARSEKVEVLKDVAKELLTSGNFSLLGGGKEYNDNEGRISICFCICVNEDSILVNSLSEIGEALNRQTPVQGVVTKVREQNIKVDINGIEGIINRANLSILNIPDARMYFTEGGTIKMIPIEMKENGLVEFSLKNTVSDPNHFLSSEVRIGDQIKGRITYIDDSFIKLDIGHEQISGKAFREDLTKSRFIFLHEKFSLGQELDFVVKAYNYDKGNVILTATDNDDVWPLKGQYRKGMTVTFKVCKKSLRSFLGELNEGIEGVLPYNELDFFEKEIEIRKNEIRLNDQISCTITDINNDERKVFLSCRDSRNNPYQDFFNVNSGGTFDFIIDEINTYGILGHLTGLDRDYDVHIPTYEMSWGKQEYTYRVKSKKKVTITSVDRKGDRFVGSFKSVIKHPLSDFQANHNEGQILTNLKVKSIFEHGISYSINYKSREYEGILFKGEISNLCFISSCLEFKNLAKTSLCIKQIDLEKNRIFLSLKDLTQKNFSAANLDYGVEYSGVILGRKNKNYAVLIKNEMVEGILETTNTYSVGEIISVSVALVGDKEIIFSD